ncbi:beta-lactamase-like protein [Lenzites betulinus]|nr:beta-lactamase-like protein [Lenzites betulinus]
MSETTSASESAPNSPPTITVLYFAAASTATGLTIERVPLPLNSLTDKSDSAHNETETDGFPLSALADVLAARHAGTRLGAVLAQSGWAVDAEMVDDPARVVLRGGEEVAVICPVSGGHQQLPSFKGPPSTVTSYEPIAINLVKHRHPPFTSPMCRFDPPKPLPNPAPNHADGLSPPTFTARRLTPSTFLITEVDDIYDEHPFIYARTVPGARTLLLLDTGCGGAARAPPTAFPRLRDFLECAPVAENGGVPLNVGGVMRYVAVLSHCHYDHILGVEQFATDSLIIASGHDPAFIAPNRLPEHSLCANLGIPTPSYTPTLLPDYSPVFSADGDPLGVVLLHAPGHTPDELALWDEGEGMLYVGDTLYEWAPIIFPNEGSIVVWLDTIDKLIAVVQSSARAEEVLISCGHKTAGQPALEVLRTTLAFMMDVLEGREAVKRRMEKRGEVHVEYVQEGERYSLICPERLVEEARKAFIFNLSSGRCPARAEPGMHLPR